MLIEHFLNLVHLLPLYKNISQLFFILLSYIQRRLGRFIRLSQSLLDLLHYCIFPFIGSLLFDERLTMIYQLTFDGFGIFFITNDTWLIVLYAIFLDNINFSLGRFWCVLLIGPTCGVSVSAIIRPYFIKKYLRLLSNLISCVCVSLIQQ